MVEAAVCTPVAADLDAPEVDVNARGRVIVQAAVQERDVVRRRRLGGERVLPEGVIASAGRARVHADDDLAARAVTVTTAHADRVEGLDSAACGWPTACPWENVSGRRKALEGSVDDGVGDRHGRRRVLSGDNAGGDSRGGGDGRLGRVSRRYRLDDRRGRRGGQDAAAGAADA